MWSHGWAVVSSWFGGAWVGWLIFLGGWGLGGAWLRPRSPHTRSHTRTHAYTHTQQCTDLLLSLRVVQGHSQLLALVGERLHDPLLAPAVAAVVYFFNKFILGVGRES